MSAFVPPSVFAQFLSKSMMLASAALLLLCLWAGIFLDSLWAWVAGWLYLGYDVLMMLFVLWQTRHLQAQALPDAAASAQPLASQPSSIQPSFTQQSSTQKTSANSVIVVSTTATAVTALSVTVLIPARNEQLMLPRCLAAVMAQDYPINRICIVDDGSRDATAALLQRDYGIGTDLGWVQSHSDARLSVLRLAPQGKARALNAALSHTQSDLVITLDADTLLKPQAIRAVVQAFLQNPTWVAAGGVLQPVCLARDTSPLRRHFLQFFQRFEYVMSYLSRAAWGQARALLLVSGAFAIYRTEALKAINGFDPHSMVEDYEVNHRIYRYAAEQGFNWTVGVVGQALATTDAPNGLKKFLQQRQRWFGGFLATQWQHLDMMANPAFGRVGRVMLPLKVLDALQPFLGVMALGFLVSLAVQQQAVLWMVLWVVLTKLCVDVCFYAWALRCYGRWVEQAAGLSFAQMLLATLTAPLSFNVLKLYAALLGWWVFLSNTRSWKAQR